jgi:hypothetical protein
LSPSDTIAAPTSVVTARRLGQALSHRRVILAKQARGDDGRVLESDGAHHSVDLTVDAFGLCGAGMLIGDH